LRKPVEVRPIEITVLPAFKAELHGNLKLSRVRLWTEEWISLDDYVAWKVMVPKESAGDYEVAMIYSCVDGSEIEISVGNSRVVAEVNETKGIWPDNLRNFEKRKIDGTLQLPEGVNTIRIRATRKSSPHSVIMNLFSLELIPPVANKTITLLEEKAKNMRASTEWFVEAKYGLMFHWTPQSQPRHGPQKPYPEAVRDFNVNAFADMVEEAGAGYIIFTTAHGIHYFPAPIQSIENILPGRTCQRDLVAELADALSEREIKLILYYNPGNDPEWREASGYGKWVAPDLYDDEECKERFFNNFCNILTEIGQRYGDKVAGYFFDGGFETFLYPFNAPWERMFKAAKAGNPNRIITWNNWIFPKITSFQEYWAGELGGALPGPPEKDLFEDGPQSGLQPHLLPYLDDPWVHDKPNTDISPPLFTTQKLVSWVEACISRKFVVSLNIGIYQNGAVSSATFEQVKAVRDAIRGK